MKTEFTGGSLLFKGDKKANKTKKKSKHKIRANDNEVFVATVASDATDSALSDMTEAERKSLKRQKERERLELEKAAKKSHRERVDEFNEKLSTLTEHNDIPRVSAAGNG
jgi:protein FAM32A